jgi:hypothetical protein
MRSCAKSSCRVKRESFYLYLPDSDEVIILGLLPRGGAFRSRVLGPRFEQY